MAGGPEFPRWLRLPNWVARVGWDNPDNVSVIGA